MPVMKADGTNTARQHQRDGDQRRADLLHRAIGGLARAQALGHVALDVLDDDDGVVDDDADRQHEAEQRQVVEREAERRHQEERADERHRDGDDGNDGRAPCLQEQHDDEHDEDDRLEDRLTRRRRPTAE